MKDSTATQPEGQAETYVDELGRKAGTVYTDWLGHRRVVTAPKFYSDDGKLVVTGHEAIAVWVAHVGEVQEHNRQALASLKPHELGRLETWLRTRTHTTPSVRPLSRPSTGRAPREARNARQRGSRRGARSTSSSSDDPGPDPEPPERRLCQNARCAADISHLHSLREFCDNACKQAAYRDRLTHEHLDELVGTVAAVSCRCAPKGMLVVGGVCFACGRPRGLVTRAWLDDEGVPARSFVATPARADTWRTRPDRKLSAKLRHTRGRWDEPEAVAA